MKHHVVFVAISLLALSAMLASCGGGNAPASALAYVAHPQSFSLSVISIPADKTVSNIAIGTSTTGPSASYPTGVAVTPDGSRVYVTDGNTSVWAVDTSDNDVVAKIAAGSDPEAIAITPDGKSAYVTSITCGPVSCSAPSNPPQLASVEVIDTASNTLTATITIGNLPVGQTPGVLLSGVAISPDGTRVYVSNYDGNQIWAIDTASNQVVATIPTAVVGFAGMSIGPDGSHLYAAGVGNPSVVDVIDTKTDTVDASIALGNELPTKIAVTPDGGHAYVTGDAGHLWVIDTATNTTVATIPIADGQPLLDIAFTPDGTRAYITCGSNNAIYILDTTNSSILGHITSDYPGGLAVAPLK